MGIFRIFRKQAESPRVEAKHAVFLTDVPAWAEKEFGKGVNEAKRKAKSMQSDVLKIASQTKENMLVLGRAKFEGKGRAASSINMTKNSYVKRSLPVINGIHLQDSETFGGLAGFNVKLAAGLRELNRLSPKQMILLSKYFEKDAAGFVSNLKEFGSAAQEYDKFLSTGGKLISMAEKLNHNTAQIQALIGKVKDLGNAEKNLKDAISGLVDFKKEAEARREILFFSGDYKEMKDLEDLMKKNDEMLAGLERDMNGMFNSARRPLKKMEHLLGKKDIPNNPFREIVLFGKEDEFLQTLETAKNLALEGKIELKAKEVEKLAKLVENMKYEIPRFRKIYTQFFEASRDAEHRIAEMDVSGRRKAIEQEVGDLAGKLKVREAELAQKVVEKALAEADIQRLRQESEAAVLDAAGRKLEIKL
jgi:uncharacterized protein YoxC